MNFTLPLVLSLLAADPQRPFTSPQSEVPEYGHGLTETESRDGWISLFDGETSFGWKESKVENGILSGGETTSVFGGYEVQAEVVSRGTLELGGETVRISPGNFERKVNAQKPFPIRLGTGVQLKTLLVKPLGLDPLFNGKSLKGWKVLPHPQLPKERQASWSFKEGAIVAKGGPGALEWESKTYGDVVLQVEAGTRATLVNGGVFFRAIPGDFLNGYEVQIFHACYDRDPSKPARYSTGAIDDRQLARRLVSQDNLPFMMTVIAAGPHIATWVNGHQMTDWTDTREPNENPRQGLRLEPGAIQLQAHDKDTDIEFRRILAGSLE